MAHFNLCTECLVAYRLLHVQVILKYNYKTERFFLACLVALSHKSNAFVSRF
jgi:hypothetical protein